MFNQPLKMETMLLRGPSYQARIARLTILHAVEVVLGVRLAHGQGVVPCLLNAPGRSCTRGPGNHVRSKLD
jgi:hypothetical protein